MAAATAARAWKRRREIGLEPPRRSASRNANPLLPPPDAARPFGRENVKTIIGTRICPQLLVGAVSPVATAGEAIPNLVVKQ
jgi:hypothetical protein